MANICDYRMLVKGKKENIEAFLDALQQKDDTYIGRGCVVNDLDFDDELAFVDGCTKWSINASLISDANSMKASKEAVVNGTGKSSWDFCDKDIRDFNFLTVFEACEKFNVNMEVYSQEEGQEFQEHLKYENGEITNESTEWRVEYDEDMNQIGTSGGFVDDIYDGVDFDLADVEEKADLER